MRAAYQTILEGGSIYGIAKTFTASGIKRDRAQDASWRTQTIRNMLLNERNAGRLVVKGTLYSDTLPRIVEPETFEQVRSILTNPARVPKRGPKPRQWAATGIVRCGTCGSYLSQTGARGSGKRNMRCAPDSRPVDSVGKIHPAMDAGLLDTQLGVVVMMRVLQQGLRGDAVEVGATPISGLQYELAELSRKRDLAQESLFEPGVNIAKMRADIAKWGLLIGQAQAALDAALAADIATAATQTVIADMKLAMENPDVETTAQLDYWRSLSVDDQRALARAVLLAPKLYTRENARQGFRVWDESLN